MTKQQVNKEFAQKERQIVLAQRTEGLLGTGLFHFIIIADPEDYEAASAYVANKYFTKERVLANLLAFCEAN